MSELNLVCFHLEECVLIPHITQALRDYLDLEVHMSKVDPDIQPFFSSDRSQYDAAGIINKFETHNNNGRTILLTGVDLYIPIFTFIFGLAKLNGRTGIVSAHRLRSDYYGLPPDDELLKQRLVKEIIHELGHLLNLRHCPNYQCVMASSNTADDLDVKGERYCKACMELLEVE